MWPIQDFQRTNLAISILGIILINEEKNRYNLNVPLIMCNILPLIMCNTLNGTLLMFDLSKKKKKKKTFLPASYGIFGQIPKDLVISLPKGRATGDFMKKVLLATWAPRDR